MDQSANKRQSQFLYNLIANPANQGQEYMNDLQQLVKNYPQSGILQAILANANGAITIRQAATYFDPASLYKIIKTPGDLPVVEPGQIFFQPGSVGTKYSPQLAAPQPEPATPVASAATETVIEEEVKEAEVTTAAEETPAEAAPVEDIAAPFVEEEAIPDGDLQASEEVAEPQVDEDIYHAQAEEEAVPGAAVAEQEEEITPAEAAPVEDIAVPFVEEETIPDGDLQAAEEVAEPPVDEDIYPAQAEEETLPEAAATEQEEEITPAEALVEVKEEPVAASLEKTTEVPDGDLQAAEEVAEPPVDEDIYPQEETPEEEIVEEEAADEEIEEAADEEIQEDEEEVIPVEEEAIAAIEFTPAAEPYDEDGIEDEIYEEIVGIEDINIDEIRPGIADDVAIFTFSDPFSEQETDLLVSEAADVEEDAKASKPAQTEHGFRLDDEADKLIVGNIAATDYFMFDQAFGRAVEEDAVSEVVPEPSPEETKVEVQQQVTATAAAAPVEEEPQQVARYHDEKMPYSFLWWLDKTRKEHAGVYQPFSVAKPQSSSVEGTAPDALQQQYYENIFHITSVDDLDKNTAQNGGEEVKHKGDEIIERFIKEEPQIRPTNTLKLDTENKAKKSAEDQNDLVTETLANIYAEQMLYPKAIAIYKKLMLKFPEKSRYFADRIENLTKKTT